MHSGRVSTEIGKPGLHEVAGSVNASMGWQWCSGICLRTGFAGKS